MPCSIDVDSDYMKCDLHVSKVVKAKKHHKCCECGNIINPGEEYEKVVGKWDGYFSEYKTCKVCLEIRKNIFCSWCYSTMWQDLWNDTDAGRYFEYGMIDGLSLEAIDKIEKYFEKEWN